MKFFDISLPLHEGMVVWPGDENFELEEKRGTGIVSGLKLSTHTGTHIDAPKHFLFDKSGADEIDLKKLIGSCRVVEMSAKKLINERDVRGIKVYKGDKILFKTRNNKLYRLKKFTSDYVSLSLEAAKFLAAKKIDLVGIDYYGIEEKSAPGHPVHKTLLRAGIVIVEGLDLSRARPGNYNLAVLPLRVVGADGSPARAILWR